MSIQVGCVNQISVLDTADGAYVSSGDNTTTVNGLNSTRTLTASTTPPVTKHSAGTLTLSSGSGTLDLTSLPDPVTGVAAVITLNGLKPQEAIFRNKSTNANAITIVKGASNGYTGFGSAFSVTLQPGDSWRFQGNDNSGVTDVGSGAKTLDVTGTGSQVLEFQIVGG